MVAQYADGCNFFGDPEQARHLLGVLEGHCERLGRDPAEITKTSMRTIAIAESEGQLRRSSTRCAPRLHERRITATVTGTPDRILENAQAFRDVGIEGLTFSMPDVHDLEAVAAARRSPRSSTRSASRRLPSPSRRAGRLDCNRMLSRSHRPARAAESELGGAPA